MPKGPEEVVVAVTNARPCRCQRQPWVIRLARFALALSLTGFLALTASAAVLPADRADALYHSYDGGVEITGPSLLFRKNIKDKVGVRANYYVDMISSASIDVVATASPYTEERTQIGVDADYRQNSAEPGLH